ncbi:uncharacterized protein PRCAT00004480001 [Priceomyces carsonii]|uniref:uncharacterized protein n=1 Tax=Priceomyces carsonii TaxID=28549 RepID=UPI002ED7A83A|nr:unnamed protein product [Priceomyces carsonii]
MLRKAKIFLVNSRKLHIPCLKISEEVKQALSEKRPVVSLESTIYTHGFPYPENYSLAKEVEKVVKNSGAVPATCGFIKGKPVVGLDTQELAYLTEQRSANKVSRRDIGYTISKEVNGGTTIALTMILSNLAGINVFATGGLGGVHRDGQFTMDISADLTELGRTPVAVVCSGPKSILDIERTMEYLETQGVFVGTYNDDNRAEVQVPGFYTRESGVLSPYAFSSFREAASIILNSKSMMLNSGHLFCIPPPKDIALESNYIDLIIEAANISAKEKAITGKRLTPYLLKQIAEATNGRSVTCNYDFVLNNAKCGSEIAKELCKLEKVSIEF